MPCYYNYGDVLLLEVPMEEVLTKEQKEKLAELFESKGLYCPQNWFDTQEYNVDADYHEVLGGYVIDGLIEKGLLSEFFSKNEPVEPQGVQVIKMHPLDDQVQQIAPHAHLCKCAVAFVSILV